MRFGVLGSTLMWSADGDEVPVGGPRVRTLLTLLLVDAGQIVTTERLIDGLYGEDPPANAVNALQAQVSRLRRALAGEIESHPTGYRLSANWVEIDAHVFARLAADGRHALAGGDHARAAKLLREALHLWRGPALSDAPLAEAEATRLEELRMTASEDLFEAELAAGDNPGLIAELRQAVARNPLRERQRALLMRALYAAGRQAEALEVFEEARTLLADELGADPSPELAETHLAVLRSQDRPKKRALPAQLTSFVGRAEERDYVAALLGTSRLVTLLGPGGAGKTRLAVEAAGTLDGEICFVDLAALAEGDQVAHALVAALGLRDAGGFSAAATGDIVDRLTTALADRPVLLLVDNCEHVIADIAQLMHELLAACPRLRVLATSREALGITGETLHPLSGLTPEAARRLFTDRALAVRRDFVADPSLIDRICAGLDGLPLAIELAAARLRTLSPADIAARLDDRFQLLSRGDRTKAHRHQTLHAVVGWSWDLLSPSEQAVARRLTVFTGGASLAAAERVCALPDAIELLADLVDKSFIEVVDGRYRMLETIRAFCAEHLSEADAVRDAHLAYFLELVQTAEPHLRGSEQLGWIALLNTEHANILAALRRAVHTAPHTALLLAGELASYWYLRGLRAEVAPIATELLGKIGTTPPEGLSEEYVLCVLNAVIVHGAETPWLLPHLAAARAIVFAQASPPRLPYLVVLWALTAGPLDVPDDRPAETYFDSSGWLQGLRHFSAGWNGLFTGDIATARDGFEQALVRYRAVGDRWGMSNAVDALAMLAHWRGEFDEALRLTDEAISLTAELEGMEDLADLTCRRAARLLHSGDLAGAQQDYLRAEVLARRTGIPETIANAQRGLGDIARLLGRRSEAQHFYELALAGSRADTVGASGVRSAVLVGLAHLATDPAAVRSLHDQVRSTAAGLHLVAADIAEGLASLAVLEGDGTQAALLLGASVVIRGTELVGDTEVARTIAAARALIGDDFDTAYRRGLALPRPDALSLAGI
ncbi:BTAD domain-containing putative transcriptional regulator [Kutzneria chonburiensis]|uniref:BTAD domain-containing putative transcriptional regulator n=1 Tax=Kutzneria chonburiensis TaxID=1483604 RepID=A0ABV6MS20_9PSEU|nr:BTAD domain-containing putative transcriptional regulator [Kutzneria chonburiensis]